ncbi:MAG: GAF domain-containing protein [Blastocatellia bacterium]|nr:GAF domain-containing protein [Blastocatellia bacterium]
MKFKPARLTAVVVFGIAFGLAFVCGLHETTSLPAAKAQTQPSSAPATVPSLIEGERPSFRFYAERDGLPQNAVMDVTLDRKGYLWVGTQNGAACFNGRTWTVVNLPNRRLSNSVQALLAASDGSLWIGTYGAGLSRLKDGNWTTFDKQSGPFASNVVTALLETSTEGRSLIWAGTEDGLFQFDGTLWKRADQPTWGLTQPLAVISLLETATAQGQPVIWAGTRNQGLVRLENNRFTVLQTANSGLPGNTVFSLTETPQASGSRFLWVGTNLGTACVAPAEGETQGPEFHPDRLRWQSFTPRNSPLPHGEVRAVQAVTDTFGRQTVWLGTYNGGLARLSYPDGLTQPPVAEQLAWQVFNPRNVLFPDNCIRSFCPVPNGPGRVTLWIGTNHSGLACFEPNNWTTFDPKSSPLPGNVVRSFCETLSAVGKSQIWLGTDGAGIACLEWEAKQPVWTLYSKSNSGLLEDDISSIIEGRGPGGSRQMWFGTYSGGLSCLDNGSWKTFTPENSGLPHISVSCLALAPDDSSEPGLWVGTYGGGIGRFHKQQWEVFNTGNSGIPNDRVERIWVRKTKTGTRQVWVGTGNQGMACLENGVWKIFTSQNSALPNNLVYSFWETTDTQGNPVLWAGTGSGVVRLNPDAPETTWKPLSEAEYPALAYKVVSRILEDHSKRLYLCTFQGIVRLTPRVPTPENTAEFDTYTFTTEDGLPGNGVNPGAALCDRTGNIWVGTLYGAARLTPAPLPSASSAKPLVLEHLRVNQQERTLAPETVFTYAENNLTFEFALLSFFRSQETRFRTQLIGFEPQPLPWSGQTRREYTNLGPGSYTFQVWGQDHAGNQTGPVSWSFVIKPAPWKSVWAWLLYAMLLLSGGNALYSWRVRLLHQRQEVRLAALRQLLDSIQVINSKLDLRTVLEKIVEESALLIQAQPGAVGLMEGNRLVFKRVWLEGNWTENPITFELGQGIAGKVAATAQPIMANTPVETMSTAYPDHLKRHRISRLMALPILSRSGKVFGVLTLIRFEGQPPFTEEECALVESLTHQAAVAIENAELYGELEKLYQNEQQVTFALQELNRMKTNFIAVTSHEMRTPLTVLRGYTEALSQGWLGQVTKEQQDSLDACRRMVDRMTVNFNHILEMQRLNENQVMLNLVECDLCELARTAADEVKPFLTQRTQRLTLDLPASLWLRLDWDKISLVLINLLQNAIKFTPDGGQIELTVLTWDETVEITVRDQGVGISQEDLDRVFDMFYTGSDTSTHSSGRFEFGTRGQGLGLTITKRYVEAHGGTIRVESPGINQGTTFHIWLPYSH